MARSVAQTYVDNAVPRGSRRMMWLILVCCGGGGELFNVCCMVLNVRCAVLGGVETVCIVMVVRQRQACVSQACVAGRVTAGVRAHVQRVRCVRRGGAGDPWSTHRYVGYVNELTYPSLNKSHSLSTVHMETHPAVIEED